MQPGEARGQVPSSGNMRHLTSFLSHAGVLEAKYSGARTLKNRNKVLTQEDQPRRTSCKRQGPRETQGGVCFRRGVSIDIRFETSRPPLDDGGNFSEGPTEDADEQGDSVDGKISSMLLIQFWNPHRQQVV